MHKHEEYQIISIVGSIKYNVTFGHPNLVSQNPPFLHTSMLRVYQISL